MVVAGLALAAAICVLCSSREALAQSMPHEFEGLGALPAKPGPAGAESPWVWMRLQQEAQGMDLRFANGVDAELLQAVRQGRWAQALNLVKQSRANPNATDEFGVSPLVLAVHAGQDELVRELLIRGANPNVVGADGYTPLGAAAQDGYPELIKALLKAGARLDLPGATGLMPMHLACAGGHLAALNELLKSGADASMPNTHGLHAMDMAAYHGQVAVMKRLLEAGMPLDAVDERGLNALHAAAIGRQVDAASWLQQQGVKSRSALTDVLLEKMQEPWPVD